MDYEDYTLADDIDELIAKLEDHLRLLVEWDANSSVIDANTGELVALDVPKEDLHNLGAETIEQTRG